VRRGLHVCPEEDLEDYQTAPNPIGGYDTVIEEAVSYRYLPSGIMLSCLSMNLPSLQPKGSGRATERLRGCGHQQPASYVALRTSDEPVPFSSAYLSLLSAKDNCTIILHIFEVMLSAVIGNVEGEIR
jgi:hypothetical protein